MRKKSRKPWVIKVDLWFMKTLMIIGMCGYWCCVIRCYISRCILILHFATAIDNVTQSLIHFDPFWTDLTYRFRLKDFCKGRLLAFYCCALWSILRCFCYKVDAFAQFLASFSSFITKGQIISKYLFVSSNFSKKQTITRRIAVETNSLVVFWKKFKVWQISFKINWPLRIGNAGAGQL